MEEVAKIADRVILIHQGGIVAEGKPDELLTQYQTNNLEDVYIQLTASENRRNKI
jgi:ABC-2 type transport system ATP-binding protein